MRIISGTAKGRRLASPPGSGTRPMTDRTREALFSSLGGAVDGARVADLFAGSGSLGLEALSRGAASCVFVERDRKALAALGANVDTLGLGGRIVGGDVTRFLGGAAGSAFDLVFVDPPYGLALASVETILEELEPALSQDAIVVVHRRGGEAPPPRCGGLLLVDRRRYGDGELWRYRSGDAG